MKELLREHAKIIDYHLKNFLPEKLDSKWLEHNLGKPSWKYHPETYTNAISKPAWDLLNRGGKRWRPLLMLLSYQAVGGKNDIQKFLVIPELIHNGTLMVDDVEDNSTIRRGKDCIHKIYGEDIAINAGNALYYLPCLTLLKDESVPSEVKLKIYEQITKEMIKISFGQGADIYWHRNGEENISEAHYLQMCAFKTGTLARLSAKLGAILGEANETQIHALGKFAESLGVAFQIQDDILNITNKKWGKEFGDDITEGKRTLMVIKVCQEGTHEDKKELLSILNLQTRDQGLIERAVSILEKYDTPNYAKKRAKEIVGEAWGKLNNTLPESEVKAKLKLFADFVVNREI